MFVTLNAVIVDADQNNRQELAQYLQGHGVHVLAQLDTLEPLTGLLSRAEPPQIAIVNLDPGAMESLKRIAHLPRQFPSTAMFVMSQVLDPNLLMEAMAIGVREFIPLPIQEAKFVAALERVAQVHGMGKRARVINVIPTIGGCGSTTIACNLAAALSSKSKSVIVDLDLVRGGVASAFDVRPRYTVADVMQSADKVDRQVLDNALAIHRASNLAILARPELPEDTQRVNQPGTQRLFNVLGRMFDYVVTDSMMSIDPVYATAIHASDINVIVMQLNVPSAKNAERFVGCLRRMGIESSKIRIVVNRYVKKGSDIEPEEVERALGLKINWMVPNDFKNAIAAINFGEPVVLRAPRSEMSQSLVGMADVLASGLKAIAA
ncbi:MAG TPA: AAA family ATPase [Tepidisphaeraceae bacterium]|nr:AAA family ATPase [Tepidisphaeraceae bacterium]